MRYRKAVLYSRKGPLNKSRSLSCSPIVSSRKMLFHFAHTSNYLQPRFAILIFYCFARFSSETESRNCPYIKCCYVKKWILCHFKLAAIRADFALRCMHGPQWLWQKMLPAKKSTWLQLVFVCPIFRHGQVKNEDTGLFSHSSLLYFWGI